MKWYRKAAEQGKASAQFNLGVCYADGQGVKQDDREAVKWYRKAAEQRNDIAQYTLGLYYEDGKGVKQDYREAMKWYRKAAEQGNTKAQFSLGLCYANGQGIERDYPEAVKWWHKAAEHESEIGGPNAQFNLGLCYYKGQGVIEDYTESYKWFLLAGMNGKDVSEIKNDLKKEMTVRQIAEAQQRAKEFTARKNKEEKQTATDEDAKDVKTTGTGFFISSRGYIITSYHVVDGAKAVKVLTKQGTYPAKVINTDSANDIAILKVQGQGFGALPLVSSSSVKTGDKVFTIGFPNVGLQGFEPKYTEGVISSLSGAMDNPCFFQISTPVQPGNSGGPLINEKGCIVGVITARLSERAALLTVDALPENVNYALKSSYVLAFLEALPEVAGNPDVENKAMSNERSEQIEKVKQTVGLVLCY